MESLRWVDETYVAKHKGEDPNSLRAMYYPNMHKYTHQGPAPAAGDKPSENAPKQAAIKFLTRYARKAGISLAIYLLSLLPYVGRFVLPAASFYTFNKQVGLQPAILIFGTSVFLPKRYLVYFLQSYFASRSLMRELVRLSETHDRPMKLTDNAARALLFPHPLHPSTKEDLVPRSRRRSFRLWSWLLRFPQDPSPRCSHLWHC
jgi:hypothetical protein